MKSLFSLLFASSLTSTELPVEKSPTVHNSPIEVAAAAPSGEIAAPALSLVSNANLPALTPQKDPKATEILSKVTSTTKTRKTIDLQFTFTVKNGDMEEKQEGSLKIKGDKYWYEIFGAQKMSDGIKTAEVIVEDKEVTIGSVNFNDPDEFSPQEMFSIYEKGYKYRHMGTQSINGQTLDLIDLYPDADNTQPYRRVTLFVNTTTNEIKKIELFHKTSAKVFSVNVKKYSYDAAMPDSMFQCDCSRWPSAKGWDCDDTSGSK